MRKQNLFIISGPSGAGKGTLVQRLFEGIPDGWLSVSATTRDPRPGEIRDVSYHYITDEEFDDLVAQDGFLEWAAYSTAKYGTPKAPVLEHLSQGQQVVLEIEVQGARIVREKYPEVHTIFIEPPSLEELRHRLESRGTESAEVIEKRMKAAEGELAAKGEYDICIVNDNLDVAAQQLIDYVNQKAGEGEALEATGEEER